MHLRTFSSLNHNFHSTFFSSSSTRYSIPFPPTDLYAQRSCDSKFKTGFCSFRKMEFGSPIVLRNHGGLRSGIRCEEGFTEKDDGFYIRRAVELAKKAIGCTSPNPMVGCVLVKDGEIIGEGFHPKAGQPHAEVFALRDAGDAAENATAYVSLEPCNHHGRTPPCTEALIRAKVKRVVVGMVDPNPIVASKGVERLRATGIDVTVGVEEELCKNLNEAYIHRMLTGKPFVTIRYSPSCQSELLQEYDGIIVSSALLTNKSLFSTSQEPLTKEPLQIVVARTLDSPLQLPPLTAGAATQVIIFTENNTVVNPETSQQGVETVVLDRLNLNAILDYCAQRGFCSVLLNLSGNHGEDLDELVKEGLEQGLLQKVVMEVLPSSDTSEESSEQQTLKKLGDLKKVQYRSSNEGVMVEGYF